ncbi:MAG TPA: hypothetical protein VFS52_06165 [Steroidobacteraceae bacterium]|nr:hypothetical protein [Steroidobacteraceae bacterium]
MALEDRTARLTILIDPRKKALFERLCAEEDATPSQVLRRLIRGYIEQRTGRPWTPPEEQAPKRRGARSSAARRSGRS